jgi:ABC-type nickel/cobalt efflux system permease component RcnA
LLVEGFPKSFPRTRSKLIISEKKKARPARTRAHTHTHTHTHTHISDPPPIQVEKESLAENGCFKSSRDDRSNIFQERCALSLCLCLSFSLSLFPPPSFSLIFSLLSPSFFLFLLFLFSLSPPHPPKLIYENKEKKISSRDVWTHSDTHQNQYL